MTVLLEQEAESPTSILGSKLALEMDIKGTFDLLDFSQQDHALRSQATRDAIMKAARLHFLEHGFQSTRLANVARDAYVAPSTVSLHFKGKDALFAACLIQDVDRMHAVAQRVIQGNPVAHTSGDFVRVVAQLLPRFPLLATAITLSPHRWGRPFYDNPHVARATNQLETEIRELQAQGIVRSDLDPSTTAVDLFRARACALWTVVTSEELGASSLEFLLGMTTDAILAPSAKVRFEALANPWRCRMSHGPMPGSALTSQAARTIPTPAA